MKPPRRARLANGLVVIARANRATGSVAARLLFQAGAAFDPRGRDGTAQMTAALLDRGAGGRTASEIADGFDFLGATYQAAARRDTLEVEARCLAPHLPGILRLLALIAARPDFPEDEVRREKGQTLTALAERAQDPATVARETLDAALFPAGHPYHHPRFGTTASVEVMTRDDLAGFHRSRLGPRGAILALAGDFDAGAAIDAAAAAFGEWQDGAGQDRAGPDAARPSFPDPPELPGPVVLVKPIPGKPQADIAVGFRGLSRRAPDLPAAMVMSNALGEFGLGGRLAEAVRERAGLAYYAHSTFAPGLGAGPFLVRAGVASDKVAKAAALIRRTIARFVRSGPTPAEVADAKQALASSIPRRLETNPDAASYLADAEFYGHGLDYAERLPGLIRAVTHRQARDCARRILTLGRHVLVVAGPDLKEEVLR
jgi:zinc protease